MPSAHFKGDNISNLSNVVGRTKDVDKPTKKEEVHDVHICKRGLSLPRALIKV